MSGRGAMPTVAFLTRTPQTRPRDTLQQVLGGLALVRLVSALADAPDAVAVVLEPDAVLGQKELRAAPGLRWVGILSAATDNIDLAAARRLGIEVFNAPGTNRGEAADHTMALILAVLRDLPGGMQAARCDALDVTRTAPLRVQGARLGLVGFGAVGQLVAEEAVALGMNVGVHNRSGVPARFAARVTVAPDLATLLGWADVVSVHVQLTPGTRGLIDASALAMMRLGARLVNTARASIVDQSALLDALDRGRVAAAGLDVLDSDAEETTARLVRHPRVIATPHMGWYSPESAVGLYQFVGGLLAKRMRAALGGTEDERD